MADTNPATGSNLQVNTNHGSQKQTEFELWQQQMNSGSKMNLLGDDSGTKLKLKYVTKNSQNEIAYESVEPDKTPTLSHKHSKKESTQLVQNASKIGDSMQFKNKKDKKLKSS